ncbi:hypothetical protein [Pantanalinema sp. GBBB05]|uniref:hypothetical protein n=1 Tax=Pantanalinema sp. GBBB05 TaxID=2604139 RepID=UPI001DEBD055|nr:hypothetical protein [Pantanalinema sp. GBBB05]
MWLLSSPDLPDTAIEAPTGAPLCSVDLDHSMAPLCRIDYQAEQPGITTETDPTTALIPVPNLTGDTITVTTTGLVDVVVVHHNGFTFTPALNPNNPQPGEFVFIVATGSLTLTFDNTYHLIPGLALQILGGVAAIPTDYVDPYLFSALFNLPIYGAITWTLGTENQPSGSLVAIANGSTINAVRERFKKGTEITFAGIGFHISNYKEKLKHLKQEPGKTYEIQISLSGKWERKRYQHPSFLNPTAARRLATGGLPYQDPECSLAGTPTGSGLYGVRKFKTSVFELAEQRGVPFVAHNPPLMNEPDAIEVLAGSTSVRDRLLSVRLQQLRAIRRRVPGAHLEAWELPIPKDSPRDATEQWESAARGLLRQNGCFIDFTKPDAVRARAIEDVRQWRHNVVELDVTVKGDTEFSDGYLGYGVEYIASKLSGAFSEIPFMSFYEDAQAMAQYPPRIRWKRKEPLRRTITTGDEDITAPPPELSTLKTLSLNWDQSGRTKELIRTTSEDGVEVLRERVVYGLAYTSDQVSNLDSSGYAIDGRNPIKGSASEFWQPVQTETTETILDDGTGYFLGSRTIGQKQARFKQESDQGLEVLRYGATGSSLTPEELALKNSYKFNWQSSIQVEKKLLCSFDSYYGDASNEVPPFDVQKICNPDGTSVLKAVKDPNYTRPMFELASRSFKSTFAAIKNPESTILNPLPDLCTGEESEIYKFVDIIPDPTGTFAVNLNPFEKSEDKTAEKRDIFIERTCQTSAQGANFTEIATQRNFTEHDGRPSTAQRRPPKYEKEQYELNVGDPNNWKDPYRRKYEWILCTPGRDPAEPSQGGLNVPNARYFSQALTAAKTDYKIRDVLESVDFSYSIPFNAAIRPLDKDLIAVGDESYNVRVTSVSQTVTFQGEINGLPVLSAPQGTKLSAGIDREVPITVTKRPLPLPPFEPRAGSSGRQLLGDLELGVVLKTRGNY